MPKQKIQFCPVFLVWYSLLLFNKTLKPGVKVHECLSSDSFYISEEPVLLFPPSPLHPPYLNPQHFKVGGAHCPSTVCMHIGRSSGAIFQGGFRHTLLLSLSSTVVRKSHFKLVAVLAILSPNQRMAQLAVCSRGTAFVLLLHSHPALGTREHGWDQPRVRAWDSSVGGCSARMLQWSTVKCQTR